VSLGNSCDEFFPVGVAGFERTLTAPQAFAVSRTCCFTTPLIATTGTPE